MCGCGLIILQLYGLSVEYSIITLVVLLILLLAYYVFAPKTGWVLLLTPVFYMLHISYAVPVVVGLTVGIAGIVPAFLEHICILHCPSAVNLHCLPQCSAKGILYRRLYL